MALSPASPGAEREAGRVAPAVPNPRVTQADDGGPAHAAEEVVAAAPAGRGDDAAAAGRAVRAEVWGPFQLAKIFSKGVCVGAGATCGLRQDPRVNAQCKKSVTFGRQNLSLDTLYLRLKRRLIAGRSLGEEDRALHVAMGGAHLAEFAEGLSEEEMLALL
jgi:hypothetical protein